MPTRITYYAAVDPEYPDERPRGVIRRVFVDKGDYDEVFSRELRWKPTSLLYSYENGSTENEFREITEDAANEIVERIRREVAERGAQPI